MSPEQIEDIKRRINVYKDACMAKMDAHWDLLDALFADTALMAHFHPETGQSPIYLEAGSWECANPYGVCFYNRLTDPALDHCLYCGQPHERG